MNISPNNKKIEKYLDELADEYKTLLFNALISRSDNLDELSVSELLRIDNEIKKPLIENYQRQQKRRKMLLMYGVAYILVGFIMFILYYSRKSNIFFNSDGIILLVSLVVSMVGLVITVFSFVAPVSKHSFSNRSFASQEDNKKILEYDVITKWRELEGIVNDLAENSNISMPRSIIEYLGECKLIDEEEMLAMKRFLKIRNNIVHSTSDKYSVDEIKESSVKLSQIIDKLKKIYN